MNRIFVPVLLAVLIALAAWSQPVLAQKGKKAAGMHGTVTAVDKEARTIGVRVGKKKSSATITVKFDAMTEFFKETDDPEARPEKITVDELQPGSPVAVVIDSKDPNFASKVTVVTMEKKKKKKNQ